MGKRRKAREIVLQALYESEFSDRAKDEIIANQTDRRSSSEDTVTYARELFAAVLENREGLDEKIEAALKNWEFDRVSIVDRNIVRLALAELLFFPDVPTKVVINEAIEIAHKFSSNEAGRFVNGLLDRFAQQFRQDIT